MGPPSVPVSGSPLRGALTTWRKVRRAIASHRLRRTEPRVAHPDEVIAHLDAFMERIFELTVPGCDVADFEEALANACACVEEWAV